MFEDQEHKFSSSSYVVLSGLFQSYLSPGARWLMRPFHIIFFVKKESDLHKILLIKNGIIIIGCWLLAYEKKLTRHAPKTKQSNYMLQRRNCKISYVKMLLQAFLNAKSLLIVLISILSNNSTLIHNMVKPFNSCDIDDIK